MKRWDLYNEMDGFRLHEAATIAAVTLAVTAASAGYSAVEQKKAQKRQQEAEMQARKQAVEANKPMEETAKLSLDDTSDMTKVDPFGGLLIEPKKKTSNLGSSGSFGLGIGV
jgi:hypothetical protein